MNLHRMLLRRAAERRPLRVVLIGAGKFGSMYPRPGQAHAGDSRRRRRRSRARPRARIAARVSAGPRSAIAARSLADAGRAGTTFVTDDPLGADRVARRRDRHRRHRPSARRHSPRARLLRARQAHRDGERRSRRAGGAAARASARARPASSTRSPTATSRRSSARWSTGARAAGFEVIAAGKGTKYLPEYHASTPATVWRILRVHAGDGRGRRLQRADVQLVPRRHQERDRDGGGRQCHGAPAGARRASRFRRAASTICRASCSRAPRAERSTTRVRSR